MKSDKKKSLPLNFYCTDANTQQNVSFCRVSCLLNEQQIVSDRLVCVSVDSGQLKYCEAILQTSFLCYIYVTLSLSFAFYCIDSQPETFFFLSTRMNNSQQNVLLSCVSFCTTSKQTTGSLRVSGWCCFWDRANFLLFFGCSSGSSRLCVTVHLSLTATGPWEQSERAWRQSNIAEVETAI